MNIMCSLLLASSFGSAQQPEPAILSPESFRPYIERFIQQEADPAGETKLSIPNDQAWSFLSQNIPWFDCPDSQLLQTYYFRWWTFRKHLKQTPAGWVITEFLPPVPWASIYNTISCAAGHHIYEGRWLWDRKYVEDYARFWTFPEASPRNYSFWFADSVRAAALAHGDNRLAIKLLPNLVSNYRAWERSNQNQDGLFHQSDNRDGMEFSLGGSGCRPSINSYMYGEAKAISEIASQAKDKALAEEFKLKAQSLKKAVQERLWNKEASFFLTENSSVRELIGFIPWYFNLPDPGYESAWKVLLDPQGFAAPYGPATVERRAKDFMKAESHDCLWNGPSWPYATTQTLVAMANLLNNYKQEAITPRDYFNLLTIYSRSHQKDGKAWIAEDLHPDTGKWIVDEPRSIYYNHSGFADLVISGIVGLRPRQDNRIVVKPLVPTGEWDWFCLDKVPYHGQSLMIVWDRDGKRYGKGAGFQIWVNGKQAASRKTLGNLEAKLDQSNEPRPKADPVWVKHPGPVLGGDLGTCFDISVLKDGATFKMYFSWRPKQSIAEVESADGIHWSEPKILIGPAKTGWEDDINRPDVIKVGGTYHMWYTGQFRGCSAIGYATSKDGVNWLRRDKPVLEAQQAWEKVAVMCPSVLWDEKAQLFKMWYSGGEQYEPDAIGYAESKDGIAWKKLDAPVFEADPNSLWEQHKVTACQVVKIDGWYTMFYIGFRDIDHAQIGIARSIDGIKGWERLKSNPIISPTIDGWDGEACYKPYAVYDSGQKQWFLWYNGRRASFEQIGLATKKGKGLGF